METPIDGDVAPTVELSLNIWRALRIPKHHTRCLSRGRAVCLVPGDWLLNLKQQKIQSSDQFYRLESAETEQFLAPSCSSLPRPWQRISVKVIFKDDLLVPRLDEGPLYKTMPSTSLLELLAHTARQNFSNLWATAHIQYHGITEESHDQEKDEWHRVVKRFLQKFTPGIYIQLREGYQLSQQSDTLSDRARIEDDFPHHNTVPIIALIENESHFFVIQPYVESKLKNVVSYSPAIFSSSYAKALFVLYQILQAMKTFHELGLSVGDLNINSILLDKNLWVYLPIPRLKNFHITETCGHLNLASLDVQSATMSGKINQALDFRNGPSPVTAAQSFIQSCRYMQFDIGHLPGLMDDWVHRRLSNFHYLMILNHLAGRRMGDPNHHPVIPWVMDFSSLEEGYRDLKRSKFRLNKGDSQLDFTYEVMSSTAGNSGNIAHHVSDVLSDITYFVYKARQTPKSILCTHVRSKWVPNEYPLSMQRMQEWTPDECIPEFFTDPSIFTSIHEDLPDLELPAWCNDADDFICKHMAVLESDLVSDMLHYWIDLAFGYKLSGSAAVKSKNIYLQLVDSHKTITNYGVMQLFSQPHPHRLSWGRVPSHHPVRVPRNVLQTQTVEENASQEKRLVQSASLTTESQRPELAAIVLPADYNPIALLEHSEALGNFSSKAMRDLPPSLKSKRKSCPTEMDLVARDMQAFGCLMCEMFMSSKLHMQTPSASLGERYRVLQSLIASDKSDIPRCIRRAVEKLLKLEAVTVNGNLSPLPLFEYDIVDVEGHPPPSPVLLLQPMVDILPFPTYFPELYNSLCHIKEKDCEIDRVVAAGCRTSYERNKIIKILAREKVKFLEEFLFKFQGNIGTEGIEILLPYLEELFENVDTSVQAAWYLFSLISNELSPEETAKRFIPHLTEIMGGENLTPKHLKLYHHTFLIQLMVRFRLKSFLVNFSTLLVEATAGYKDFAINNFSDEIQDTDEPEADVSDRSHDADKSLQTLQDELKVEQHWTETYGQDASDAVESNGNSDLCEDVKNSSRDNQDDEFGDSLSLDEDETGQRNNTDISLDATSIGKLSVKSNQSDVSLSDLDTDEDSSAFEAASQASTSSFMQYIENTPLEIAINPGANAENDNLDSKDRTDSVSSYSEISSLSDSNFPVSFGLIRSETDEFNQTVSETGLVSTVNIRDVAAESIKWLSHKLGPVLAAKYLSRNLLRMLALCYLGDEQLAISTVSGEREQLKTSQLICGDDNAKLILDCLLFVALLYGEHVILLQYIPAMIDLINVAKRRLTQRAEAGLICAIVLLRSIVPLLSDKTLMDILQDTLIREILKPVMELVSSVTVGFPTGSLFRTALCYKIIDVMYTLGLRLGFETTRTYMTEILRFFFSSFDTVHGCQPATQPPMQFKMPSINVQHTNKMEKSKYLDSLDDSYCNIKIDDSTHEYTIGSPVILNSYSPRSSSCHKSIKSPYSLSPCSFADDKDEPDNTSTSTSTSKEHAQQELAEVFKPELALAAYIPLCRIFGSIHMEQCLNNDDLIRQLCAQQDATMDRASDSDTSSPTSPQSEKLSSPESDENSAVSSPKGIGSNIKVVGNRINFETQPEPAPSSPDMMQFGRSYKQSRILTMDPDETKNIEMEHGKQRHLRGDWLAYWEHELGLSERDILFNFKQIKLQTFLGHGNSIRCLASLDSENSFISASKDKTVKLWSLRSFGDGSGKCSCQWTYTQHKKSILSIVYLENLKRVASCDSTVHIWDPFTGDLVQKFESSRHSPVIVLATIPAPCPMIVTATTDSTIRFLDMRAASYAHEYKCTTTSTGLIRSVAVSPDSRWIAIGFSSGFITLLDVNTGMFIGTWKAHDGEILQIKAYNKYYFVSTSFDQTVKLWNVDDGKEICMFKGHTEPVHCVSFYRDQIITGTTGNKIGVHTSVDRQASFTSTKLKSDTFKGVLTSMAVLPLNRSLILGADNGAIRLFC